jgi:hypothetical protein
MGVRVLGARCIYMRNLLPGLRWAVWATIYRGGFYNVTASVNILTETVVLGKPPRLD